MNPFPKHGFLLIFLLGSCAPSWAATQQYPCLDNDATAELAANFRDLRAVRGHFDGGAWNEDVDAWMGRKHTLMIRLASRLSDGRCVKTELTEILGPTDQVTRPGEPLFEQLVASNPLHDTVSELLVYHWRGSHDFLFFVSKDDKITNHYWWYAGEE